MTMVYAVRFDKDDQRIPLKVLREERCDTREEADGMYEDMKLAFRALWLPVYIVMQEGNMVVREERANQ